MKLLALEFCKCRRRKLTLVCAGLLAAQLLWFGVYLTRQDAEALAQGWMLLLYNLAMVDAIMLPIGVAVIASRSCELEHRGHTLKLLETAVTPGRLYAAKLAWDALDSVSKHNFDSPFASTEWSIIYDKVSGAVRYYHRENYDHVYSFELEM